MRKGEKPKLAAILMLAAALGGAGGWVANAISDTETLVGEGEAVVRDVDGKRAQGEPAPQKDALKCPD